MSVAKCVHWKEWDLDGRYTETGKKKKKRNITQLLEIGCLEYCSLTSTDV